MSRSFIPALFIIGGIVVIVFHRPIAANTIETSRMFRIPLLFPEKNMAYYWIAIGVFMILVGVLFLFPSLRL